MNETTLITVKDAAKAIALQTVFTTQAVEDMLIYAIKNGMVCGFETYIDEEEKRTCEDTIARISEAEDAWEDSMYQRW